MNSFILVHKSQAIILSLLSWHVPDQLARPSAWLRHNNRSCESFLTTSQSSWPCGLRWLSCRRMLKPLLLMVLFPHQFFYNYRYQWPRPQFSYLDREVALDSTHISQLLLLVISSSQSSGSRMKLPDDRERITWFTSALFVNPLNVISSRV